MKCSRCGSDCERPHEADCLKGLPFATWGEVKSMPLCESCDDTIRETLSEAFLKKCPPHFKDALEFALGDFSVSDSETDMIDVAWNLGDYINEGSAFEYADFFNHQPPPTREEYRSMFGDLLGALDEKSPRCGGIEDRDPMGWTFVSQLFKEGEQ